ncbi:type II secretion system minor pseudopilin GspJ [Serratia sp. EWG9]|uniref:type II secretion system minor pseudopilin GspJ n=1 Tax=Serratia sp. EWG9 TaxID=2785628 RepID=UPI001CA8B5B6|nr:type II secretion system minor pseudopilin GspJ [Serratia sp. EWG9]
MLQTAGEEGGDFQLLLIRNGWPNPQARLPRATQERVAYRYRQGRLERLSYPSLSSPQAAVRSVLLLSEVTRFQLRFYRQGEWLTAWRAGGLLPQAVEIAIDTPALGEVRRIVTLPAARPL